MIPAIHSKTVRFFLAAALATRVFAQTSGSGTTTSPATNQFVAFDRPEAWALKYFTSASILSGLQPPDASPEARRFGSITVGMELGWIPELSREQQNVGFNGRAFNDLNQAPILARPSIRVGLPAKFTVLAAAPAPFRVFGVTPHLLALGVERPLVDRGPWRIGWRASGQVGHVKGAFTCPRSVLGFTPGSPDNPGRCVAESHDVENRTVPILDEGGGSRWACAGATPTVVSSRRPSRFIVLIVSFTPRSGPAPSPPR